METSMRRLLSAGLGLGLLVSCGATPVRFVCTDADPLCRLAEVMDDRPYASGVDISGLTITQGVEKVLMADGLAVDDGLRLAAERDAVLRVEVSPHDDFESRDLSARLLLYKQGTLVDAMEASASIHGASDLSNLGSTLNIRVPGSGLPAGEFEYAVELLEAEEGVSASGSEGLVVWPEDGTALLTPSTSGVLRIHLIPVEYGGELPPTDEGQLAIYQEYMYDQYPVTAVEIELGEVYEAPGNVNVSSLNGWSALLDQVGALRSERGVEDDQYIYGAFLANNTGGVAGLCNLAFSAGDSWSRACIGLGFNGSSSAETMIHEVGHAHGRYHSPCGGAAGPDPDYPHDDAIIGVRGYDLTSDTMFESDQYYDYMSYCWPTWVSDFTWEATFTRIADVNELMSAQATPELYQSVWVYPDGSTRWGEVQHVVGGLVGEQLDLELLDPSGASLGHARGVMAGLDHAPGGMLRIPLEQVPIEASAGRLDRRD
mgnify:CR=1 FL=1